MTKSEINEAERIALNTLDEWNDVTGAIQKHSGWYGELQSVVEDAVQIGIQMALRGKVTKNENGEITRSD